ncbi:MAG: hypothetical protein JWN07_34 [Hyphomicrobiales bacterium]|nr:hypothetical protein [Hyphomicrobiales bacterium]
MKRAKHILTFTAAIGAGLLAASAFAQQPASPPPPPAPGQTAPQAAPAPRGPSTEDRAAFFDARVAAIHAGLRLTPDQERLWPPVETAVRDMARQMSEMREQRRSQAAPTDPVERMARMGDASTKRGQALSRFADAARPLYASLTDEQKRRLRVLMRAPGRDRDGMRMGMGRDEHGPRGHHRHDRMADGRGDRDHDRGMRDDDRRGDGPRGEGRGRRGGEDRDFGSWNNWR